MSVMVKAVEAYVKAIQKQETPFGPALKVEGADRIIADGLREDFIGSSARIKVLIEVAYEMGARGASERVNRIRNVAERVQEVADKFNNHTFGKGAGDGQMVLDFALATQGLLDEIKMNEEG